MPDNFTSNANRAADKRASEALTNKIHNSFSDVFSGIGCFERTLQIVGQRRQAAISNASKKGNTYFAGEELERLQRQEVIVPLAIDKKSDWCKRFVLVPKANEKVRLCLDPARLNKALIRPIHRGPTLNVTLPRLAGVKYITLIDVNSGFHNLKLDDILSYLITFYVYLAVIDM